MRKHIFWKRRCLPWYKIEYKDNTKRVRLTHTQSSTSSDSAVWKFVAVVDCLCVCTFVHISVVQFCGPESLWLCQSVVQISEMWAWQTQENNKRLKGKWGMSVCWLVNWLHIHLHTHLHKYIKFQRKRCWKTYKN